jgi:hypothetical protein
VSTSTVEKPQAKNRATTKPTSQAEIFGARWALSGDVMSPGPVFDRKNIADFQRTSASVFDDRREMNADSHRPEFVAV